MKDKKSNYQLIDLIKTKDFDGAINLLTVILAGNQLELFPQFPKTIDSNVEKEVINSYVNNANSFGVNKNDISDAYWRHPDIFSLTEALVSKTPIESLSALNPIPFLLIHQAKAKRFFSPVTAWEKIKKDKWLVEPKHDGYYGQIHIANGKVVVLMRSGIEKTNIVVTIAKDCQLFFGDEKIILECEMIPISKNNGTVLPRTHFYRKDVNHKGVIFNILYNKKSLLNKSNIFRRKVLEMLFLNYSGKFLILNKQKLVAKKEQFIKSYYEFQDAQFEGMIAKQATGLYKPGGKNNSFIKIKVKDNVDAVIIGYSENPRSYLAALWDKHSKKYIPFVWVTPNKNKNLIAEIVEELVEVDSPISVGNRTTKNRVRPQLIIELEGDKIFPTDKFPCGILQTGQGWSIFSPNLVEVRLDKHISPNEVTSVKEFLEYPVMMGYPKPKLLKLK